MIWQIAWKNVWRNKLRSLVVITAVLVGILAGSFAIGIMTGVAEQRTENFINNETSHIQIHNPKFLLNQEPEYAIRKKNELFSILDTMQEVKSKTSRIKINAMIASSSGGNSATTVVGINPETEKTVTKIYDCLRDSASTYFESNFKNPILIGKKMAEQLKFDRYSLSKKSFVFLETQNISKDIITKLKTIESQKFRKYHLFKDSIKSIIGDKDFNDNEYFIKKSALYFRHSGKVLLTFMDKDGKQTGGAFRVTGIFASKNSMFDRSNVFVKESDLERLSGYGHQNPQEIAILLKDKNQVEKISNILQKTFPDLKIESWKVSNPEVAMLSDYIDIFNYFIIILILAALAFGIVNTMLMAIMERTKELGMLAAIGMTKKRRFSMIMLETVFLTAIGAFTGMIINVILMNYFSIHGLDLSKEIGDGMEAMGYGSVMYPVMYTKHYISIGILVVLTAILSAIYPGLKALRLNPSNALRADI